MSAVKLLVLGSVLRRGTSHGYGVYADITAWHADSWTQVKPGSIYHAMEKLAAQGKLRAVESNAESKPGPARTEYAVTNAGEEEFGELLEAALTNHEIQSFAVGVAFMEWLPRERAMALLERRRSSLEQSAAFLRTLPVEERPADPSRHPELVGLWVSYVESQAANTGAMAARLREGKYRFRGESHEGGIDE